MSKDEPSHLREQAAKCRRLSAACSDDLAAAALDRLAIDYDARASAADRALEPPTG